MSSLKRDNIALDITYIGLENDPEASSPIGDRAMALSYHFRGDRNDYSKDNKTVPILFIEADFGAGTITLTFIDKTKGQNIKLISEFFPEDVLNNRQVEYALVAESIYEQPRKDRDRINRENKKDNSNQASQAVAKTMLQHMPRGQDFAKILSPEEQIRLGRFVAAFALAKSDLYFMTTSIYITCPDNLPVPSNIVALERQCGTLKALASNRPAGREGSAFKASAALWFN